MEIIAGGVEGGGAAPPRRPLWLVAALTFLTGGLYLLLWCSLTWAELKQAFRDPQMRPVWHALSLLVPLYGLFQLHEHFALIRNELRGTESTATVHPGRAVGAWLAAAAVTPFGGSTPGLGRTALALLGMALQIWVLTHGQAGLNAYWQARAGRPLPARVTRAEGVLLVVCALLWTVWLLWLRRV